MQLLNDLPYLLLAFLPVHDIPQRTNLTLAMQTRYEFFVLGETLPENQWLTTLNDELLLHFQPVPLPVKFLISLLLQVFIQYLLHQQIVHGRNYLHVWCQGVLVLGELPFVEFMRLKEHVEDENLYEHKHSYQEFLQGFINPEKTIILRNTYLFHFIGCPKSSDCEASFPTQIRQNLRKSRDLLRRRVLPQFLDPEMHQLHNHVFLLLPDLLTGAWLEESEVKIGLLQDYWQSILLRV